MAGQVDGAWQLVYYKFADTSQLKIVSIVIHADAETVTFKTSRDQTLKLCYRCSTGEGTLCSGDDKFEAWGPPGKPSVIMFGSATKHPSKRLLLSGYIQRLGFPVDVEDTQWMHEVSTGLESNFTELRSTISQANVRITHAANSAKKYSKGVKETLSPEIMDRLKGYGNEDSPFPDPGAKRKERDLLFVVAGSAIKNMRQLLVASAEPQATKSATSVKISQIFDAVRDRLEKALMTAGVVSDGPSGSELGLYFERVVAFLKIANPDANHDSGKTEHLYMDRIAKLRVDERSFCENGADPEHFRPYRKVQEEIASLSTLVAAISEKDKKMSAIMDSAKKLEAELEAEWPIMEAATEELAPPKKRRRMSLWNPFGFGGGA